MKALTPLPPPHIPSPYANPVCCGEKTALRVFSYQCLLCRAEHPFLDDKGQGYIRRSPVSRKRQSKKGARRG